MDSDDFFLVASQLTPKGGEPIDRSAVSRIYYGTFHQAMEFLTARHQIRDFAPQRDPYGQRTEGSHEAVVRLLTAVNENAGDALGELKERRRRADYDLKEPWEASWRLEVEEQANYLRGIFGTR